MAYTKLLNEIIDMSGLTLKEIANRCTHYGVNITSSYISTLRNNANNRTPSDEVSRAIAKACSYKNENALIIEAYIDNAPDEMTSIFNIIKNMASFGVIGCLENAFSENEIKLIREQFESMPIADFIIELSKQGNIDFNKYQDAFNMSMLQDNGSQIFQATMNAAAGFTVQDNGMFPMIQKGNKVNITIRPIDEYKDGDIIAVKNIQKDNIIYRKIAFLSKDHNEFVLFPLNAEYETITTSFEEYQIIGKVTQVIAEI